MIRLYIDFDGTITRLDVGDSLFERFGGKQCAEAIRIYREGAISATECFRRECAACGDVPVGEMNAFLDGQDIDTTFAAFLAFCRERGLSCTILSDGMDYYIQRILSHHKLEVPFLSNHLTLVPASTEGSVRFVPSFPYTDEVCDRCACCKRNNILTQSADEDIIVYVGEGYSDRCPARYADVVFAKDELRTYCQEENISFFEYATFADIQLRLEQMMDKPKGKIMLRKRRQAELARREVYLGG